MEDFKLSDELLQLECDLFGRSLSDVPESLRQKVLADVRIQQRREHWGSRWQFAFGLTAAALLWINLSLSVIQATSFGFQQDQSHPSIETAAMDIQHLVPEFSSQEARREALLMQVATRTYPCPKLSGDYRSFRTKM